jgi:HSP20 family protein
MISDIVRLDPLRQMSALRAEIDRAFGRVAGDGTMTGITWAPVSDVVETDDAIVITAELPGVKDEDIEISVHRGILEIRGERRREEEVRKEGYVHRERSYGGFRRSFRLPEGTREEDIHAATSYGVLKVTLPKPAEETARKIAIGTGA